MPYSGPHPTRTLTARIRILDLKRRLPVSLSVTCCTFPLDRRDAQELHRTVKEEGGRWNQVRWEVFVRLRCSGSLAAWIGQEQQIGTRSTTPHLWRKAHLLTWSCCKMFRCSGRIAPLVSSFWTLTTECWRTGVLWPARNAKAGSRRMAVSRHCWWPLTHLSSWFLCLETSWCAMWWWKTSAPSPPPVSSLWISQWPIFSSLCWTLRSLWYDHLSPICAFARACAICQDPPAVIV